jgi:Helix-turn-helix domain
MTNLNRSDDNDLLVALRHPLRRRILREMANEETISPRELAAALREPLSNVAYHVRVLADCSVATLVKATPVRGSMQHFYCASIEAPWAREVLGLDEPDGGTAGESSADRALSRPGRAMDETGDSWTTAAQDAATESAVLRQVLDLHPIQLTLDELTRELGGELPEFAERDAIDRAVRDLSGAGLLHLRDSFVLATRAALRFNELLGH